MDKVAALSARERRALFQEAASGRGMNPAVMEKDFWVSWVLGNLFRDVELKDHLIFKGGTTLSKIFGVIDRFSEDIDLILDWQLIGFGPDGRDPLEVFASATQQDRFNKEMNTLARNYIAGPLLKRLRVTLASMPGIEVALDHADGHTVNVGYPASFAVGYLRPEIRLEIGPLGSWLPSSEFTIQPYAAQALPEAFSTTVVRVKAIDAERTFWEKATILHQEAHRTSPVPTRYSRHYYDLFQLSESAVKAKALASPCASQGRRRLQAKVLSIDLGSLRSCATWQFSTLARRRPRGRSGEGLPGHGPDDLWRCPSVR